MGRTIRELLLWVRFHRDAPPEWCNVVENLVDEELSVRPLPIGARGGTHLVRTPFGPGAVGVHWGMS